MKGGEGACDWLRVGGGQAAATRAGDVWGGHAESAQVGWDGRGRKRAGARGGLSSPCEGGSGVGRTRPYRYKRGTLPVRYCS